MTVTVPPGSRRRTFVRRDARRCAKDTDWIVMLLDVFPDGCSVRVSAALFPKYDRNLGAAGNNERDRTFVVAHQRLVHDAAHPSHVVLPVVPR